MATQVKQVDKQDDPLMGAVASIGTDYLKSKIGAGASKAVDATKKSDAAGSGTGLNEMMDAFGMGGGSKNSSSVSNPRDRRMSRGY